MENQTASQDDVKVRVQVFAQAILDCEEYRAFMQSNEELEKDQEARNLLFRYQKKQQELHWNSYDSATLDELKDLQMKVKNNESLTKFFNAQTALVALLKQTNDRISERIGQPFAQQRRGGCC